MSSLKEMIRERKIAESLLEAPSEPGGAAQRSLQVHAWNGKKWVLPWGYFYSASLEEMADHDQLVLQIAHHEVVLDGVRLALLLPKIADHQLDCLRELPPKFQTEADKATPFIHRISVRLSSTPESGVEAP